MAAATYNVEELAIPDPFPSSAPQPIIPVDEEDVEDPDTDQIETLKLTDPKGALELARQKVRHSSQQMEKLGRKMTPSEPAPVPSSVPSTKKTD